jgi:hypothetical protein
MNVKKQKKSINQSVSIYIVKMFTYALQPEESSRNIKENQNTEVRNNDVSQSVLIGGTSCAFSQSPD